jgi:hypothetical protein
MPGRSSLRPLLSLIVVAVAGIAMVAGCLLPWLDTGGVNIGTRVVAGAPSGIQTTVGIVAFVGGIVVLVAATLVLLLPRVSKLWALAVLLAGAAGMIAAAAMFADPSGAYVRFAANESGRDLREVSNSLKALFNVGGLRSGLGVGVYVTAAGSGLAIVGAAALAVRRRVGAHARLNTRENVQSAVEIPTESKAGPDLEGEQARPRIPTTRETDASDSLWTHTSVALDEQPAAGPGPSPERLPGPADADHWR